MKKANKGKAALERTAPVESGNPWFARGLWVYPAIALISGACVMSLEMVGSRMVAPVLGNSIFVWSILIGVVLVGLSAGGLVGGILIDRKASGLLLVTFAGIGSIGMSLVPLFLEMTRDRFTGASALGGGLFFVAFLFFLPCFACGAVSPLSIRLASSVAGSAKVGFCAGLIGTAGSLGSFAGVIAAPFLLIPYLPLSLSLFGLAFLNLIAISLLALPNPELKGRIFKRIGIFGVIVAALFALDKFGSGEKEAVGGKTVYSRNTPYHFIQVVDQGETRYLKLDTTFEGGITQGREELPLQYQNSWKLVTDRDEGVRRALCIGAGAFGIPERISQEFPEAVIEVAEIDPDVVRVGFEFFGLGEFPKVKPTADDGRMYLARLAGDTVYDFVFLDAYNGIRYIPPHLATVEFFQLLESHLSDDALVLANVISPSVGEQSSLLWSFVRTLEEVFGEVRIYPQSQYGGRISQNVILACGKGDLSFLPSSFIADHGKLAEQFGNLLTDELNPVELSVASQIMSGQ